MADGGPRELVERYWAALAARDFEAAAAFLHPSFTEDWPQSGERILSVENWLQMVRSHPTFPAIGRSSHSGEGSFWVSELHFEYPGPSGSAPFEVCAVQQLRDDRILHITEYFAAPFEPAAWRAPYVVLTGATG